MIHYLLPLLLSMGLGMGLSMGVVYAQDDLFEDDLFGSSDGIVNDIDPETPADAANDLLVNDGVVIGGSFSLSASFTFDPSADDILASMASGFDNLSTRIFMDARPDSNFALFAKADISYSTSDNLSYDLREMFVDFDWNDSVYIRAGKQTVNWGVGNFFRPANLINIENVDPEDPDAELAGPVALKAQYPIDTNNLTGYLVLDDLANDIPLALAGRYEFLFQGFEITTGAVYQYDSPLAAMLTVTGNINSDLSIFGEAVISTQQEKRFVINDDDSPIGISTTQLPDDIFVQATIGGRYSYTSEDEALRLNVSAQYYYNGLGYADSSILIDKQAEIGALLANGSLSSADLRERGRNYAALHLSANDLMDSDLSPSLFWIGNLDDGSGQMRASIGYGGFDYLTPSASYRYSYGEEGAEYSPRGESHSVSLGLSIRGSF